MHTLVTNLQSPTDAQVEEIVKLVTEAFSDVLLPEPSVLLMTGGNSELIPDLYRLSVRTAALEGKLTVCEETQTSKILSAACSYGPGQFFLGSQKQRDLGFDEYLNKLSTEGKEWWEDVSDFFGRTKVPCLIADFKYFAMVKDMPQIVINSWFITIMATAANEQQKGHGSSVVREILRMAKEDQTVAMLSASSEKNMTFYVGLGFKVIKTSTTTSPYGTWTNYLMAWGMEEPPTRD